MAHLWTVAHTLLSMLFINYAASVLEKNKSLHLQIVHPPLAPSHHELEHQTAVFHDDHTHPGQASTYYGMKKSSNNPAMISS